ncbi:hypothetical protein [uncultured Dokdonia sp.]|uniref:hypothetical protein n=1 Tax=uncultured Dokdonia sp. TaxID=575653 RepID=UPI00261A3138|nr:hypothetical protein [uncultured Dokdonia sp.]
MTILKGYSLVYLACCLIFTIGNWKIIAQEEGWGVVYMIGLITIGLCGLLIDFVMILLIKNKKILNGIGAVLVLIFSIELWIELK